MQLDGKRKLLILAVLAVAVGALVVDELTTSSLQALALARLARRADFFVAAGPSPSIRFPQAGPYDARLGHAMLPRYIERLEQRGFGIVSQARISSAMAAISNAGLFMPYREKSVAGLSLFDCNDEPLTAYAFPERAYASFAQIPAVIVDSLLFIENRGLLDERLPQLNPAVEWDRLTLAVFDQALAWAGPGRQQPGASTLATQIEKFRHSPGGRTPSIKEKARQMASAALRAYQGGERNLPVRRQLVLDFLNSVPFAARPGYGEVHGLGDAMWAWYGRDFDTVNRRLARPVDQAVTPMQGQIFKEVLSLLIAERRPAYFLAAAHEAELDRLADVYLGLLLKEGVITPQLKDAAQSARILLRSEPPGREAPPYRQRKGANAVRTQLAALLGVPTLYELDRTDLSVSSTLHGEAQAAVTGALERLRDHRRLRASGLVGPRLLSGGDLNRVVFGVTLYERGQHQNLLRLQADNVEQPFDVNENTKLDLGSSAKLRTLATYLEIVADLHAHYAGLERSARETLEMPREDALSRWALAYLAGARERSLPAMLEAALERRYPASTGEVFFTGGGLHRFHNFRRQDDARVLSVREAFRHSVNLVFVRLMRDIANHYRYRQSESAMRVLEDARDPKRQEYLLRFADREGQVFVSRFYRKYQGKTSAEAADTLIADLRTTPRRLAAAFRAIEPEARAESLADFLAQRLPAAKLSGPEVRRLHERSSPGRLSLSDLGYLAGVHPLELWTVRFLGLHPSASESDAILASAHERRAAYRWLFDTRRKPAQDQRIRVMLERDAFGAIHRHWKRLGYPFDSLVPSYATALGASADRPASLAELIGVILDEGMRKPTARISSLNFAAGTPYETTLAYKGPAPSRVMRREVALALKAMLREVVEYGTAMRVKGAFVDASGRPLPVGGKTGTGDDRYERVDRGGRVIESRVRNRTATFAFFIGDALYGVVTAYVPGEAAARYDFTSALALQLLRSLAPSLAPLVASRKGSIDGRCGRPGEERTKQVVEGTTDSVLWPQAG